MSCVGAEQIHAHYFEDGNVQLQTNKAVPEAPLSGSNHADAIVAYINVSARRMSMLYFFVSSVLKCFTYIQTAESAVRLGLEEIFDNLNVDTLRAMRRTMTVTRTKMEWNLNWARIHKTVKK